MNLKKIFVLALILLLGSCQSLPLENQSDLLMDWAYIVRLTGLPSNSPIPKIAFLEKDYYLELQRLNCEKYQKETEEKQECLDEQSEVLKEVERTLGASIKNLYLQYLPYDWRLQNENCEECEEAKKKQCEEDKQKILDSLHEVLGRNYLSSNYIEIFPKIIDKNFRSHERLQNEWLTKERLIYHRATTGHESLHTVLYQAGIPANDHHKIMRDEKLMEKLIDHLSQKLDAPLEGLHKKLHLQSLEIGIQNDKIEKQILERINYSEQSKRNMDIKIEKIDCGF